MLRKFLEAVGLIATVAPVLAVITAFAVLVTPPGDGDEPANTDRALCADDGSRPVARPQPAPKPQRRLNTAPRAPARPRATCTAS